MICIPYFSGFGHTERLAELVAEGAGGARLIDCTKATQDDWAAMDAAVMIVFGAPTYMGSTAARFDLFLEDVADRWMENAWTDKMAAGFTVAAHPSGDKLSSLTRMAVFGAQMGMIWVGQAEIGAPVFPERAGLNRDGSWLGLMATELRDSDEMIGPEDAETARRFGARLRAAAERWQRGGAT